MNPIPAYADLFRTVPVCLVLLMGPVGSFAGPPMVPVSGDVLSGSWSRHQQQVLDPSSHPRDPAMNPGAAEDYSNSMGAAERTLDEVRRGNVEERRRDLLSEANDRYWQRRFETGTYPDDAWTPQQAGWMTPGGEPVARNWPWWAW